MKKFSNLIFILLFIIPLNGISQDVDSKPTSDAHLMKVAREIMTEAVTCALITPDKDGRPRVRVMDAFLPENDFCVWFGTTSKSRKAGQIKNNPNVTLYYLDSDNSGYVTIYGKAELINDKQAIAKYWKEEWKDFYPNKAEDYLLIKVVPEWMEVLSETYGILGDPITWKVPRVVFN